MRIMKFGKLAASLGALALVLAASEAAARAGAGGRGGVVTAHPIARPITRPIGPHAFRNHRGRNFLPLVGGTFYGPDGYPVTDVVPPGSSASSASNEVRYTYTYDVPWDWAHRYPPNVTPSDRPYVSSCTPEPVTVPGRDGGQQVVTVTRCY
jgi:hypothetical protein